MISDTRRQQAEGWAREALDRLHKDGLSPVPDNFAVYYGYFSGENPNLKMSMDALLDQFGGLTQDQCTALFQAHLGLEAEHRVLTATSASIDSELKRVMAAISQSASGATQYNQTLSAFTGELQASASLEQIRTAVGRVANETRVMAEQNQRLRTQLAQSTQQLTEVRYNLDQVRKESLVDPLTEVGNRKFFANEMTRATREARDNATPLALLVVDIDHFKKFNDTYGHLIGDQVLRLVARTLIENLKGRDIIARYGGEEFVILLPQTSAADAERVGNHLRTNLATKHIRRKNAQGTLGSVTVSVGVTEYIVQEDPEAFIARADEALYQAKQDGRNRVVARIPTEAERATAQAAPHRAEPDGEAEVTI